MTKKRRLLYILFPSYLIIILGSLLVVSWYTLNFTRQFFLENTRTHLETSGLLLEKKVLALLSPLDQPAVESLCDNAGEGTMTRITVILPDGRVVGDSEENPANMDNHKSRKEIAIAIQGSVGTSIRFSDTIKHDLMYVALPLKHDGDVIGVLRTAVALTTVEERIESLRLRILFVSLLVALLATLTNWYVSKKITARIEKMREGARRFAEGDLSHRLPMASSLEFSELAESMNQMAQKLQRRLDEIDSERNKTLSVLSSMREGVIATDNEMRVININQSAATLFGVSETEVQGRSVLEVLRSFEFQELIDRCLSTGENIESDIVFIQDKERILNVHCNPLLDGSNSRIGSLSVISDVTQLRQLESIRRDFAASVSHEIKTPLTAIKGFVETLCTSTLEDSEQTQRFLTIIDRHVKRLATIIDDLMQLSRIERDDELQQIGFECRQIQDVLNTSIGLCKDAVAAKGIEVQLDCDLGLSSCVDATLLEQAAVNLLDNAVKYSPENSVVRIDAKTVDDEIQIRFVDQGIGISKKHLPRLFERFYRVDKARSRKLGGTGLGLAIVKHIAQAHGGDVSVESELGTGSTFTLHLPKKKPV